MRANEFIVEKTQSTEQEIDEQNPAANARALTGSGLGGNTHKPNKDSKHLKKVRTPGTNYPKSVGANPGFIGG